MATPVRLVILGGVWMLFVGAVIRVGILLRDGGFDKYPTSLMVLFVVCGFLAGGCISLTKAYLRERRGE